MMRIITIIAIGLVGVSSTFADNSKKLAEEFLTILDTQNVTNQMIMQIKGMQKQQFSQMKLTEPQQQEADKFIEDSSKFMLTEMNWDSMKDAYITVYTEAFTEKELGELLEFYRSPIGKKFVEQQPAIVQKSMEIGQKKMLEILPKLQEMTASFMEKHKN